MGQGSNSNFTRQVETAVSGDVAAGPFEFELNALSPRNNLMDYFFFVDGNGTPVDAVAGTVDIELSPILPLYQSIHNGTFSAALARDATWQKPNGFGKAISLRVTFSGLLGVVGFRAHITQSVD